MLRFYFIALLILGFNVPLLAKHIKGGWVRYEHIGAATPTSSNYKITVYVFKNCNENGPMPTSLIIYDGASYATTQTISNIGGSFRLLATPIKTTFNPCLSNTPTICYQISGRMYRKG